MTTPDWATFEMFQEALRNYLKNDDVRLLRFTSNQAVLEGDNYTSDLFRTSLYYMQGKVEKSISIIVKCANEDGGTKTDLVKNLHIFEKEVDMFTRTFPIIYNILGQSYSLSSKCLYTLNDRHSIIIFEDLTTRGFKMLPRHLGFDLEHCFKVIEKMAHMHSASLLLYEKDPSLLGNYKEGLFANQKMITEWVNSSFKGLSDACSRWPGFEKYSYKLSLLGSDSYQRGLASTQRKMGGFNVLNHGDLWVNNMMFSYCNKGKLTDMRFVDFQMVVFTSPAIDLHYFIATSTNMDVKQNFISLLLDHYYAHLVVTLTKLQYCVEKIPTREQFLKDYRKRAFYGLMASATVLTFVKASSRKDASFDNIIKDHGIDGFRYHAYNNQRYRKHMEWLLPYYDTFGVLD